MICPCIFRLSLHRLYVSMISFDTKNTAFMTISAFELKLNCTNEHCCVTIIHVYILLSFNRTCSHTISKYCKYGVSSNFLWSCLFTCCEHHQYCRPALSIMPLRVLSTVSRGSHHGPHHQTSLNPTPDHNPPLFAQQSACSTSNALICSFNARWLKTALSPTSNIL